MSYGSGSLLVLTHCKTLHLSTLCHTFITCHILQTLKQFFLFLSCDVNGLALALSTLIRFQHYFKAFLSST